MEKWIDQILSEKGMAYAIFNQDFFLSEYSSNFFKIIRNELAKGKSSLWDIFPELIGSEDQAAEVLYDKSQRYELNKINVHSKEGILSYYDLLFLRLRDDSIADRRLLCIITDTTEQTSIQQKIRQQEIEIRLLQTSLLGSGQFSGATILGNSEHIQQVRSFVNRMARYKSTTILLLGPSGTGKTLVARSIHQASMCSESPFIEINCASIPELLLESEIFGYEKGAFTGAIHAKKGLLEAADCGTFFLDEIGELPMPLQSKFLSFLETKSFRRVGGTENKKVDVRIIAATNRDLKEAVDKNEFRQDLFFRLNVVNIVLPRLSELRDDILLIADHFISLYTLDFGKKVVGLTEAAKKKLLNYSWPGNVRELRNIIERAMIFTEGNYIDSAEISLIEENDKDSGAARSVLTIPNQGIKINEVEKELLSQALSKANHNQSKAAKLLGLSLDTYRYRLKKYKIMS